jgi:hypothetical protein
MLTGNENEVENPIRTIRDLAANFVRAIDQTAFDTEATDTDDLASRCAALMGLHKFNSENPELAKLSNEELGERVRLIGQVRRAWNSGGDSRSDFLWSGSIKELRGVLRDLKAEAELQQIVKAGKFDELEDDQLTEIIEQARKVQKDRERIMRKAIKQAGVFRDSPVTNVAALNGRGGPRPVTEIFGDEEHDDAELPAS